MLRAKAALKSLIACKLSSMLPKNEKEIRKSARHAKGDFPVLSYALWLHIFAPARLCGPL
jgi:hypothetical protein